MIAVQTISPQLLKAGSGDVIADLGGDDVRNSEVIDFSTDSKLMFGWLSRNAGIQYVVWDAKTGKPLKTWNRGSGDVTAAFAPGRHELAIVERSQTQLPANHLIPERIHGGILLETGGLPYSLIQTQVSTTANCPDRSYGHHWHLGSGTAGEMNRRSEIRSSINT